MPEKPETPETQEPTFELLLMLIHSPKCLHTPNRRTRNPKPKLENIGPFDVSVNIGWNTFLGTVAEKICVQCLDLPISTFEWHWLKPASGPWLPIQDENGFALMVKKIKRIKLKSEAYVMVHMDVPGKNQASASSGNARDVGDSVAVAPASFRLEL